VKNTNNAKSEVRSVFRGGFTIDFSVPTLRQYLLFIETKKVWSLFYKHNSFILQLSIKKPFGKKLSK
jgi:hypothetical protein